MTPLIEIIGWLGAVLLLLAYGLVSNGRVQGSSPAYQWLNIAGAGCIAANNGWNGAFPSAALNVVWIAIGIVALLRRRSVVQSAPSR